MINLIIVICLSLTAAGITFIPFTGKIMDRRKRRLHQIEKRGWLLIICCSITIALASAQFIINDRENKAKDFDAKLDREKREILEKKNIEESNNKIIETFTTSLARYGLKYDSSQKVIEKLVKDSAMRKITIIQEHDPTFSLCNAGIRSQKGLNDSLIFTFFTCYENSPKNIDVDAAVVSVVNGSYKKIGIVKHHFFSTSELNGSMEGNRLLIMNRDGANTFFFHLYGSYSNRSNTKTYQMDNYYIYYADKNEFGLPHSKLVEELKKFLNPS